MRFEPVRLKRWTRPDCYVGAEWPEYYSAGVGQSRGSDDLEKSNFAVMLKKLGGESETVIVVSESHWAVGWVEWIAIHETDSEALAIADDLRQALDDYPVLDESDYSEREWNTACNRWRDMGLRSRVEMCREAGISIFAARRADEIPPDDNGRLFELLVWV